MSLHSLAVFLSHFRKMPFVRRSAWIDKTVFCYDCLSVGERVKIKGRVFIGKNVFINDDSVIWGGENPVIISDNVRIYTKVMVDSGNHNYDDISFKHATSKQVLIKEFALLDNSSVICKGVTVGRGAIVMPGAVVMRDVPDFAVVVGNPAKVVGWRRNRCVK